MTNAVSNAKNKMSNVSCCV